MRISLFSSRITTLLFIVVLFLVYTNTATAQGASSVRADLHIYTNTNTPSFYKGRALPTGGSDITATVLLFTTKQLPPENYNYVWEINGVTQNKQGVLYTNTITFASVFETRMNVSVTVYSKTGVVVAQQSTSIPIVEPELHFYELNPLRGLSQNALLRNNTFLGEEITLSAEPYYIDIPGEEIKTSWKINNQEVAQLNGNPYILTLQKQQNRGRVSIGFEVVHRSKRLQSTKEKLEFQF